MSEYIDIVDIKNIAPIFNIGVDAVHKIMLAYGNKINSKLLTSSPSEGAVYTSQDIFDEIVEQLDSFNSLVVEQSKIKPTGSIPFIPRPIVYFLYDGPAMVYIGQTCNLPSRITTHLPNKKFDKIFCVESDRENMTRLEMANIIYYMPSLNKDVWSKEDMFKNILIKCYLQ